MSGEKATRIRVLIADDHRVLRESLRLLIDSQPDMVVVAELGDASGVADVVGETACDVVLQDLTMPGGGPAAIRRVRNSGHAARVLVLTMHQELALLRAAIDAGAAGYLLKEASADRLLRAVRAVASGRMHFEASLEVAGQPDSSDLDPPGCRAGDPEPNGSGKSSP